MTSVTALTAPRMTVTDIDRNEEFEAQYNPRELEIVTHAVWAKVTIPGLSHQPQHFVTTENLKVKFALTWRLTDDGPDGNLPIVGDATRFFMSLTVPISIENPRPPRVLFVWPTFISIVTTVQTVSVKPTRFSVVTATPIELVMDVEIEEVREARILSSQVRQSGMLRASTV